MPSTCLRYNGRMTKPATEPLLPAYLVVGEDALKRAAVLKRLRARVAEFGDLSFNSDELDGEFVEGSAIATSCNTMPFASELRLVYLRNADKLKKADSEVVVAYLKEPNPTTVLALEAEKLAKSTRLYKAVASVGKKAVIECAPLKKHELPKTVRAMAVGHGVAFSEGAARKLVELVGENTVHLDSEIRKIALAHQGSDAVTEAEVEAMTARTTEVKPWELVDAFSARDLRKCVLCLERMESTTPHALIAMCTTRIRELMCAQSLARRGNGHAAAIAHELGERTGRGVPEWRVKNHSAWARKYGAEELRAALASARDAEQAMKSGSDPKAVFTDWLVGVLAPR